MPSELTRSRCGRGSRSSRPTAGWSRSARPLDPAAGLAARLVAHRPRARAHRARARQRAARSSRTCWPSRALIAEALGVDEHGLGALLQRALEAPLEPVRRRRRRRARRSSRAIPTSRGCRSRASSSTRAGRTSPPGCIVARDPETGERNWSIARVRPLGGSRALVGIAPNHHLAVAARAARERGERLPIAVTIGNHPALLVAACLYLARGEDELRVAGALLGEPVALVRCTERPARGAGRVRDRAGGRARPGRRRVEEGPVSEFHGGYERYGRAATATFAPPHAPQRCDLPGRPARASTPSTRCSAASRSPRAWSARCARTRRPCTPSRCPRAAPGGWPPSSRSDRYAAGDVAAVALAALQAVNLVKLVTVVDADVDPWDDAAVAHAVATRVHFDRDLHVAARACAPIAPSRSSAAARSRSSRSTRRARRGDREDWTPAEPPR